MKKAIFICSSPRKQSNTNKIVSIVDAKFKAKGIDTEVVDVSKFKFATNGCIDCGYCQKSDKYECVIKDEASELLKKLPEYDYIIFATPVYFFSANAQLKLFLDRMQSLYKFKEGGRTCCIEYKKIGLISTGGGGPALGLDLLDEMMKILCKYTKAPYRSILVPRVQEKNVETDEEVLAQVDDFVKFFC